MKNVQRQQEAIPKYLVRRSEDVLSIALVSLLVYSAEYGCGLLRRTKPVFAQAKSQRKGPLTCK
jgi:hypothetical protein